MQKKQKPGRISGYTVYNTSSIDDKLKFDPKDRTDKLDIPVVYVYKEASKKYFSDQAATLDIKIKTDDWRKKENRS